MTSEQPAGDEIEPSDLHECRKVVDVVDDWLDDLLASPMRVGVELHLATCAGCVAYVDQARGTRRVVAELANQRPDPDARHSLLNLFRERRSR